MIFQLDERIIFPDPHLGDPDGLLAVGGDLSPERLLLAYSNGIFPWYSFRDCDEPEWYCPMERFVIFPREIHISHSMRSLARKRIFEVTFNKDFDGVIEACGSLRADEEGAWLGPEMTEAYRRLHRMGHAVSEEVWREGRLVGGLYGIWLGNAFFGESMFSLDPNASKLALISFTRMFESYGGLLIDCQFETPHLRSMGGRTIPYDDYMAIISHRGLWPDN